MKKAYATLLASVALAACSSQPGATPHDGAPTTLHEVMVKQIDANADALWDVSNTAIANDAGLDPSQMTDEKWDKIAALAGKLQAGAQALSALNPIVVVKPGMKIKDEDSKYSETSAQVQGYIDKDPEDLHGMAAALASHAGDIAAAARAHDAAKAGLLIDQLDTVCESCHVKYWYPDQRAIIEQYSKGG
jgi:hypothetical protein